MDREGLRVVPEAAPEVEGESAAAAEHGARTEARGRDGAHGWVLPSIGDGLGPAPSQST